LVLQYCAARHEHFFNTKVFVCGVLHVEQAMTLLFEEDLDEAETLSVIWSTCSTGSLDGALISVKVVGFVVLRCCKGGGRTKNERKKSQK
jgi:hypothetical protein